MAASSLFLSRPASAQLVDRKYDKYSQQQYWTTGMHPLAAPFFGMPTPGKPLEPLLNSIKVNLTRIDTNVYGTFRIALEKPFSVNEGDKIIFALEGDKIAEFVATEYVEAKLPYREKRFWVADVKYTISNKHANRIRNHLPTSLLVRHSEGSTEFKRIMPRNAEWMQDAMKELEIGTP